MLSPIPEKLKTAFVPAAKSIKAYFAPYAGKQKDREIDVLYGLRVLFILLIAWYHIWQQSWLTPRPFGVSLDFLMRSGYEWVDAMLLLSGFLLYLPCAEGQKVRARTFYRKRFARIVPSYYLCLAILLFTVILPGKLYKNAGQGIWDMLAHMTFVHTLFPYTYVGSPINGVLWTLAVEVQFYVLFPFLACAFQKKPLLTWVGMTAVALAYRSWAATQRDTALLINQLPAFMDVYANGFLAAVCYKKLRDQLGENRSGAVKVFFTAAAVLCMFGIVRLLKDQAASNGLDQLRLGQMERRFGFSALVSVMMVCLSFSLTGVRFLLGNRLMRFLSGVTFQFYMYHQAIAVQLKAWHFPPYASENPNMQGEQPWQLLFTLTVFAVTLLLSVLLTYLVEKPAARLILRGRRRIRKEEAFPVPDGK